MLVLAVVTGAVLKCDKGASPSALNATMPFTPLVECKPVATILDNKPGVNVMPFGVCAITKAPCVPATPMPWVPGETTIPLPSLYPILTEVSILPCLVGGVIKVLNAGQSSLLVDCKTDPKRLRELLEFIKSALTLRELAEFTVGLALDLADFFVDKRAALALNMSKDAFKRIFGLNLKSLRWRAGQFKMSWAFLKKGLKLKVAAKALGFLGNALAIGSIVYDASRGDYKGAAANTIGFGAGVVCTTVLASTVAGAPLIIGCAALSVGVSKFARYAIDNPKKALEIAEVVINPPGAAAKYAAKLAAEHADDIKRGAGKAKDFVVDKAGDAVHAGKDVAKGAADAAGDVLDKIKPKHIPMPFGL